MKLYPFINLPHQPLDKAAAKKRLLGFERKLKALTHHKNRDFAREDPDLVRHQNRQRELGYEQKRKVELRASKLCLASLETSGHAHLKKEELDRLLPVKDGLPAEMPGNEHWADEIAASLHAEIAMFWPGERSRLACFTRLRSAR